MPFPNAVRIVYKKNPLKRVICQLRFPPILKMESALPVDFQECIRQEFPDFGIREMSNFGIPEQILSDAPVQFLRQLTSSVGKNYEFKSQDGIWAVNLARNFMALSTKKYKKWEEFYAKFIKPLEALNDIYKPTYFSRMGLRYINVIQRSVLGLEEVSWDDLLQPYVIGLLSSNNNVSEKIKNFEATYEIGLDDNIGIARIMMGIIKINNEVCFKVDTDFFNGQKTAFEQTYETLDYLNTRASRLIQWLIKPKLHNAMEPEENVV